DRALGLRAGMFRRRSGTPLSAPWPAAYTQPVFAKQVAGGIEAEVERFLADDWVLGTDHGDALSRARTVRQVGELYEQDYLRAWDSLLADLELAPASDLQQASLQAAQLSEAGSPLRLLLDLVRTNTRGMRRMPAPEDADDTLASVAAAAT